VRNFLALTPVRKVLWPSGALATAFGPEDADYGVDLFLQQARDALRIRPDFRPRRALEIGPGRNPYTALLWSAFSDGGQILLWDVFPNMELTAEGWPRLAAEALEAWSRNSGDGRPELGQVESGLRAIAAGAGTPPIRYLVGPQRMLSEAGASFDCVYSHSALEHVWRIADLWPRLFALTSPGGIHVHQIDLCDHGRRDSNFLEMCEWSPTEWWLSQRFTPGAVNRWRASDYVAAATRAGFEVAEVQRSQRERLPVNPDRLSAPFRHLPAEDLLTGALRLTLVRPPDQAGGGD